MNTKEHLMAVYAERGVLTPEIVVNAAANTAHPLHHFFEWDDNAAAIQYRLIQAGALIRSVKVQIERSESHGTISVRAFVAKSSLMIDGVGEYVPVNDVVSNDVWKQQWFAELRRDWERLRRRAADSQEFAQMVLDDMRDVAS